MIVFYENERHKNDEGTVNTPDICAYEIESIKLLDAYLTNLWYCSDA